MTNTRISLRLPNWQVDGLDRIAESAESTNRSELIRDGISYVLTENKEHAPEWAIQESINDRIKRRNKAGLREMHFKQRVYEYAESMLFKDDGSLKEYPPEPEKADRYYFDKVEEEVRAQYKDNKQEYLEHIEEVRDWYALMHPSGPSGSATKEAIALCAHYIKWDKQGMARQVAKSASEKTQYTEHEILDKAREKTNTASWKHEWDKKTRPWVVE